MTIGTEIHGSLFSMIFPLLSMILFLAFIGFIIFIGVRVILYMNARLNNDKEILKKLEELIHKQNR